MLKKLLHGLGLAILILFPGYTSPGSRPLDSASSEDGLSSSQVPVEPGQSILRDEVVNRGETFSVTLPQRGILVALTRWGSTTLAVFDVSTRVLVPVTTKATGKLLASLAADRVAYLVREDVNPAKNYVEILDLRRGRCQLVKPANDFAILGFTLSPSGEQLAYAEMNLRWSSSRRVYWRTGLADLERYETHIPMASGKDSLPGEGIPVPFAWSSKTGEVYLQGLLPFQGMVNQGIWAMKPDGSGLRRILPEPSYTGLPRLSPDGGYLAYLTTRVEVLPRAYIPSPGAPPGNVLVVVNLLAGEQSTWVQEPEAAFGAFAWSATGREFLVSHQEWLDGRFRDAAFLKGGKGTSLQMRKIALSPSSRVTDIGACRPGSLFWVEEDNEGARLRGDGANHSPATLLSLPEGKIQLVGCLEE